MNVKRNYTMKTLIKILAAATLALTVSTTTVSAAEVEKTTTVTTSGGTISEFGPERFIIKTETSPDPVTYTYSKTTTYVDEAGSPVSIETVKSGLPVTVHYTKVGDKFVASKVIVRKTVTKTDK